MSLRNVWTLLWCEFLACSDLHDFITKARNVLGALWYVCIRSVQTLREGRVSSGRYGLGRGPRIESRWGEIFCTRPDRLGGPPRLLCSGYRVFFPGGKRPGLGIDHHLYLTPRLKEYSYTCTSRSRGFLACSAAKFTLTCTVMTRTFSVSGCALSGLRDFEKN